jgi:hypothetical protein
VIDVFYGEIELILVMLALAAVFGSAIVRMRNNETSCFPKKGRTRSFKMPAAASAFLRSYSLGKATLA